MIGGGFGARISPVGLGGTTVAPSTGSTGFSSRSLVFGNALGQLTNNSSGPTWDSTLNRMGLGTTIPDTPLHIKASSNASGTEGIATFAIAGATGYVRVANISGVAGEGSPVIESVGSSFHIGLNVLAQVTLDGGSLPALVFDARTVLGAAITGRPLFSFNNFGTPVMLLSSVGNLGIGTTAPLQPLHVNGGAIVSSNLSAGATTLQSLQSSNSTVGGTLNVAGAATLQTLQSSNSTVGGTLNVVGAATLQSLQSSATTVAGTLNVTGAATLQSLQSSATTVGGTLNVVGAATIQTLQSSNTTVGGTLHVVGVGTFDSGFLPIFDEGISQGKINTLNFVGAAVTAAVVGSTATVTVTGGGTSVAVSDEGILQGSVDAINFVGAGVSAAVVGTTATVTIAGGGGAGEEPSAADWMAL